MPTIKPKQIRAGTPAYIPGWGNSDGRMGRSNLDNMQKSFPGSPIYNDTVEHVDEAAEAAYYADEVDGVIDDQGYCFGKINRNYKDAPDISNGSVPTGGAGLPGDAHAPNVASPASGQNPADIPAAGAEVTKHSKGSDGAWSRGADGTNLNPAATSAIIGAQKPSVPLTLGSSRTLGPT